METKEQKLLRVIKEIEALRSHHEQEGDYERAQYCEQTLVNLRLELINLRVAHSKIVKPLIYMKLSISLAPNTITNHKNIIHIHRKHSTGNKLRELVTIESILNGERGAVLRERVVAMLN
jgi:hypothetical protein